MKKRIGTIPVCILLLVSSLVIVSPVESGKVSGNTLYVGGSGPGNYERIQDAIDNASDGDTIFVYNGTYYESINIDKSIILQGQNKYSTIIDGSAAKGHIIEIGKKDTQIIGFTIRNGDRGIFTEKSSYNVISDNIITDVTCGIYLYSHYSYDGIYVDHFEISSCEISKTSTGIYLIQSSSNNIYNNRILNNGVGIHLQGSWSNTITNNIFENNDIGIEFTYWYMDGGCSSNKITYNSFIENDFGISIYGSNPLNSITYNNFIDNSRALRFVLPILPQGIIVHRNYWDRPRVLPKVIFGLSLYIIIPFPRIIIDWFPAKEPYYFNRIPEISNPNPSDGQENIPTSLSELSFKINDDDNELMDFSVTTDPFIGSGSENNVGNGIYTIPISGLQHSTIYSWTVTVTDGKDTTTNIFSFTTVQESPVVTNPIPIDGSSTSTDLSELSFTLNDAQGDKMDYTVETSPDIGSDSATGVDDGIYTMPINGLQEFKWYYWYVNVTDGEHWTKEKYSFYTSVLGLVGYWSFDEGSGNIAYDASEYKNDAKLYGPTWTVDSNSGYAIDFDGIDDYTIVDNDASLNFHDTNMFTISFWFKSKGNLHPSRSETLISKGTYSTKRGYDIYIKATNRTFVFEIYNGDNNEILYTKSSIKENIWYHVVAIWDGKQLYIYLNGFLDNMKNIEGFTVIDDSKPLEFGNHYATISSEQAFHGIIDEIHIYERVISGNEIINLYQKNTKPNSLRE